MLTYDMEKRGGKTKSDFLYEAIRRDMIAGRLLSGERLPSKRALAEHLGISVITVETAYMQLVAEGYVSSRARSGFYVGGEELTESAPLYTPPALLLSDAPDKPDTEFQFSALAKIMRRVITEYSEKLLLKLPHFGAAELRNAIAAHLLRYRGMIVNPERIVIGSGAEYLYGLVAQLFGRETVFGVEHPSYEKIRLVYGAYGVKLELLTMDHDGIAKESLENTGAKVLHVTPFHSYPSGVSAPAAKRYAYIEWAKKRGGFIVEDDFDSEFSLARKPQQTVFAMDDTDSVLYINTFSKSLAPSMRMGYMILPGRLLSRYEERLGFYSCTVPAFDQYVLAEFIAQGYFERHLNRVRRLLRQRD